MADPNMLFDLNLKDTDLQAALDDFFRQAGRAFEVKDPLDGVVSVRAADLSFHDALRMLLPAGYEAHEEHGIYQIRRIAA